VLRYLYSQSIFFYPLQSCCPAQGPNDSALIIQQYKESHGTAYCLSDEDKDALVEYGARSVGSAPWLFSSVCSPKSVFALADKLDMEDLKKLALHQIISNLSIHNALQEAASPFSATFDAVRQEQVKYIKEHWVCGLPVLAPD
jgi:hypothetical protein